MTVGSLQLAVHGRHTQNDPSSKLETMNDVLRAKLIYSKYGIVMHNEDKDKIWVFLLNNRESKEKFGLAKFYLHKDYAFFNIAGSRIKLPNQY